MRKLRQHQRLLVRQKKVSIRPGKELFNMGHVKDQQIEREENWKQLCERKGWVCEICGDYPEVGNPAAYETGLCPSCHHAPD